MKLLLVKPLLANLRLAAFILLALAVPAWPLSVAHADTPVLSPAQYDQALGKVAQAVGRQIALEDAGDESKGVDPEQALNPILQCDVRDPAGKWLVAVDNRPLSDAIAAVEDMSDPEDRAQGLRQILSQVTLLRGQVGKNGSSATPQNATAAAQQVLSGQAYASEPIPAPSKLDQWIDRFDQWLSHLFSRFHPRSAPTGTINPMVPKVILWAIALLALGILLAYIIKVVSSYLANRNVVAVKPATNLAMTAQEASLVASRDFERILALARNHADEGDFRSGFRLVYLATLVFLDAEGVVRLNRSKTNWEYLRMVRGAGQEEVHVELLPMTRNFDRIWYGLRPARRDEYDGAVARYEAVHRILSPTSERRGQAVRAAT